MITTALLSLIYTLAIFALGYLTAKLIRRIEDEQFLDELHSRICEKILETELMKRELLKDVKINKEEL